MAIRIRRGLDTDRTSVVFEEGEIVYTTDTKKFYIGDGSTAGGNLVDDQQLTYSPSTNTLSISDGNSVVLSNIPLPTDIANWNDAYDNTIVSIGITGTTTKTLSLGQRDGGTLSVSYADTYVHTQGSPSSSWSVTHNMNKYPSVTVIDSSSNEVEGEVTYNSLNSVTITFSGSFSGTAYFN